MSVTKKRVINLLFYIHQRKTLLFFQSKIWDFLRSTNLAQIRLKRRLKRAILHDSVRLLAFARSLIKSLTLQISPLVKETERQLQEAHNRSLFSISVAASQRLPFHIRKLKCPHKAICTNTGTLAYYIRKNK